MNNLKNDDLVESLIVIEGKPIGTIFKVCIHEEDKNEDCYDQPAIFTKTVGTCVAETVGTFTSEKTWEDIYKQFNYMFKKVINE